MHNKSRLCANPRHFSALSMQYWHRSRHAHRSDHFLRREMKIPWFRCRCMSCATRCAPIVHACLTWYLYEPHAVMQWASNDAAVWLWSGDMALASRGRNDPSKLMYAGWEACSQHLRWDKIMSRPVSASQTHRVITLYKSMKHHMQSRCVCLHQSKVFFCLNACLQVTPGTGVYLMMPSLAYASQSCKNNRILVPYAACFRLTHDRPMAFSSQA